MATKVIYTFLTALTLGINAYAYYEAEYQHVCLFCCTTLLMCYALTTAARNTLEAIMWHGAAQNDARWTVDAFHKLSKLERDAVVKFIDAI